MYTLFKINNKITYTEYGGGIEMGKLTLTFNFVLIISMLKRNGYVLSESRKEQLQKLSK